ncbi:MAG: fibronectin type III domain-containing protein [Proteobacteria bacterium]|nr:fibronectin type III domain-containing protein [Pseudomonadota bacterium]
MNFRIGCAAVAALLATCAAASAQAATTLPALNIDPTQTTVSGLSSGAFMANQLGYAYSATFHGVAMFAGGPYMCAGHSNYTACMYNAVISTNMLNTMQADLNNWSGTAIDPKAGVAAQKIYMFVGTSDYTVGVNPMNAAQTQYTGNGVPAAGLSYVKRSNTAHVFPTDFAGSGDNACNSSTSPYIANCGYDGAKAAFNAFYGTLNPRNDAPAAGNYIEFDQTAYTTNPGMAATGWIYVPASCASGTKCRLHVALHGCLQNYATIGDKFLKNTGYTRWADTNDIVVLFPQTKVDNTSRSTAASGMLPNPNGCWDWIGWYGGNFAQKSGTQQAALKAMVDHVSSGSGGGGGTLPAPTGVATSNATTSSMTIAWNAVSGATGYDVYRNGGKVNASPVTATSYTDTGLAPATTYGWTVAAVDANGIDGAMSAAASGTTTGSAAVCYTASNYAHTVAGRAHQSLGRAYANGSNQDMGLWNVFVVTTLKQTGTNYYVIGSCP